MTKRNVPAHYKGNEERDWDLIDFVHVQGLNFNRGNVIKYVARAGKKDDELKDLLKALDYLQREIEYVEKARGLNGKEDIYRRDLSEKERTQQDTSEGIRGITEQ